jgi:protein dithiol oxidoreductase (disulfide-forming)
MMLKHLIALFLAGFTLCIQAQPRQSVEGIHYQALPKAVPTVTDEDHIEVREVFWYGCPECSTLEPIMSDWRDGTTGDLVFERMPAVWNDLMALHARLYYTARVLELENRIHAAAFRAVQEQGNPLRTEEQIRAFFVANGVSAANFETAWSSEAVATAVAQARLRTVDYAIDKLPSVIVGGRYKVVENAQVFNHVELNIAFNNVVFKLREERRSDF